MKTKISLFTSVVFVALFILPSSAFAYEDFRFLRSVGNYSAVFTWTPPEATVFDTISIPLRRTASTTEDYSLHIVNNTDGTPVCETNVKNSGELFLGIPTLVIFSCASPVSLAAGGSYAVYFQTSASPSAVSALTIFGPTNNGTFYPRAFGTCLADFTDLANTDNGNYPTTPWTPLNCSISSTESAEFGVSLAPPVEPPPAECCSSVVFLPGLEASRLYRDISIPTIGTTTKRLWEPEILHNNSDLFLNPDGTPKVSGIYTKDVIGRSYVFKTIYEGLNNSMDGLVSGGAIKEWKPFPYDWRLDVSDVVNHPIALATSSYSMVDEIIRIASSSPTKKVTIIAHSNGGLVGKELISKLVQMGRGDIVDKFVMVAVPQLGTPQTLSALLHSDNTGMPFGVLPILMNKTTSRQLSENMASGYGLLPSVDYLNHVADPVVTFSTTSALTAQYVSKYGQNINTPMELHDFLLGAEGRAKPSTSDLLTPNKLNTTLLARAETDHATLDNWTAPTTTQVFQIAGWGVPTLKGIKYEGRCTDVGCFLDHSPELTSDGDKTVVAPSAGAMATTTYWLNLKTDKKEHENILESSNLLIFLENIVQNSSSFVANITTTKPAPNPTDAPSLRLAVHSPVSLNLYDSFGNHTGVSSTTLGGDPFIDEQIPGSYYLEMGEGKYAGAEENGTTTIKLLGTGLGTFTFDIQEVRSDDSVIATTTFADIPVTASSMATISLQSLVASSTVLALDVDGDGSVDATISSGEGLSADDLVGLLKGFVSTLNLPEKKDKQLSKKIEKLQKVLEKEYKNDKNKKHKTKETIASLKKLIQQFQKKNLLTQDEATSLLNILEQISGLVVK